MACGSTYNWVAQLHLCLQRVGFAFFYKMDNIADMYAEIPHILTRVIDMRRQEDTCAMNNSNRHSQYNETWEEMKCIQQSISYYNCHKNTLISLLSLDCMMEAFFMRNKGTYLTQTHYVVNAI